MGTISIPGVAANFRTPGGYAHIEFAQGPANAAVGPRETVFVGPRLTTGVSGSVNTLYELQNEADARTYAGTGSPVHRATRNYLASGAKAKLWAVTYTCSGTAANKTFTMSGTPARQAAASVTVCGELCEFGFDTNDTCNTILTGVKNAVNSKTWLPVTAATNTSSGLVLTARVAGAEGNVAYKAWTDVTPGAGIAWGTASADLDSGATANNGRLETALAALDNVRRYYVGLPHGTDATSLGKLETHINTKSQPNPGLRSVGIGAGRGTLTATTTIANGLNHDRVQVVWQEDGEADPAQLVGEMAGIRAAAENTDTAANLAGTALNVPKAKDEADWPTPSEQSTAINEGITPIASNDAGARVVMSVNTRSKNSTGTVDDFRATETHRVSVADDYADQALQLWATNLQGQKLKDDERDADGNVDPNQKQQRGVVKPSTLRRMLITLLDQFDGDAKIQNKQASIDTMIVQKSSATSGRVEAQIDVNAIDHAHQGVFRINEVSAG